MSVRILTFTLHIKDLFCYRSVTEAKNVTEPLTEEECGGAIDEFSTDSIPFISLPFLYWPNDDFIDIAFVSFVIHFCPFAVF